MLNKYFAGGRLQDGVGLLTSILMRYTEVGSVHYWREENALKFTFLIRGTQDVKNLNELMLSALEFYHHLEGRKMRVFDVVCKAEEFVSVITITRDVDSLTQREVGLIIDLLKKNYKDQLIYDDIYISEDERIFQEEKISQMLSSIQNINFNKNVLVLREEGKVLVFKT